MGLKLLLTYLCGIVILCVYGVIEIEYLPKMAAKGVRWWLGGCLVFIGVVLLLIYTWVYL